MTDAERENPTQSVECPTSFKGSSLVAQSSPTFSQILSTMEDKILRTINTTCLNFPLSPSPPSNVVVCASLYTLHCPNSVSSSQHCLEGGGEGQSRYPSG